MKVAPITSAEAQIGSLKIGHTDVSRRIARNTDDTSVMKHIIDSGNTQLIVPLAHNRNLPVNLMEAILGREVQRELVALAENPNLTKELELGLVDTKNPRVVRVLNARTESDL